MITVSIVSHGHGLLVPPLLSDLAECPEVTAIVLTRNVPDRSDVVAAGGGLIVIENDRPKGFAANHNAAFARYGCTPYFAVVNPDVRLPGNPFPALIACLGAAGAALCGPIVRSPSGLLEDSARRFPSVGGLVRKALGRDDGRVDLVPAGAACSVPWVAGMFMLIDRDAFAAVGGFDEGFFLYYEDVDLCARLRRTGRDIRWCGSAEVVHDARRASRRNLAHMRLHAGSLLRYLWKHAGRLPRL